VTIRAPITAPQRITSTCRRLPRFTMRQAIMGRWPMRWSIGPAAKSGWSGSRNLRTERPTHSEELVAEIGACFLGARIGVAPEFGQSAAYVEGWLTALKEDKRSIFRAASEAQKAADYLLIAAGTPEEAAA